MEWRNRAAGCWHNSNENPPFCAIVLLHFLFSGLSKFELSKRLDFAQIELDFTGLD